MTVTKMLVNFFCALCLQAVHDVEAGWIRANKHEQRQLSGLKSKKSRKEYMQLVRTLKHYNFVQVLPCKADFPIEGIAATVSLGPSELCLEVATKTVRTVEFVGLAVTSNHNAIKCFNVANFFRVRLKNSISL
jgi:hypothetical protein